MSRLVVATDEKLAEVKDELQLAANFMGFEANSLKIMAHNPALLRSFLGLMGSIMTPNGKVPLELKQMVAYMVSHSSGCRYCQAHTAHGSHNLGVSDEKIQAIWRYEDSSLFTKAERAALALAQSAGLVPNLAKDEHFSVLKKYYDEEAIVEIMGVISAFGFLNRWNDTLATTLEQSPSDFGHSALTESEWSKGKH